MERIKQARAGGEKRGNSTDRAARKRWILATWDVCVHGCGTLLTPENVEADRKVPGGSYRRENIQGSCRPCPQQQPRLGRPAGRPGGMTTTAIRPEAPPMPSTPITRRTVTSAAVTGFLSRTYGWTAERAARVASIANSVAPGGKAEPTPGGFVLVTRQGAGFEIEDHTGTDITG